MKTRGTTVLLAIALIGVAPAIAQDQDSNKDATRGRESGIYPLPILFYTPETGFAGGAAALYMYRDSLDMRASSITADVIYTSKKQIIFEISGDQYFSGDKFRLLSDVLFQRYPNRYYGIGNNTAESDKEDYTAQTFALRGTLYRHIHSNFNAGPLFRYETVSMKETDPAGQLVHGTIIGSKGGTSAGVGLVANWDTRDNTFAAQSGSFYQVTALFYGGAIGSDFTYNDLQFETRNFFEIVPEQVLAVQTVGEFIDGAPSFQNLVKFGGQNLLRGYFDGRYRDKNGIAVQAEYRVPVWWRFGLVGFVGAAQVSDKVSRFAANRFWVAGGVGLRFAWNPKERVNIRLDYGIGNNDSGTYITVTEAF